MLRNILVCALGLALNAQASPKTEMPQMVGGYQASKVDAPVILEAKAFVQKHLAILKIESVKEAKIQIVAGTNIKLICRVAEKGDSGTWEFLVFRKLGGGWRLESARRTGN